MAFVPLKTNPQYSQLPSFTCHLNPSLQHRNPPRIVRKRATINRRLALISSLLVAKTPVLLLHVQDAVALDLRLTVPDQTVEQAEEEIRPHARDLLQVKDLFESSPPEEWKEARRELRKSAAKLKLDMYTIIQSKQGEERPLLRKLYYKLFSNVSGMDFAARDKDAAGVWACYGNMVEALDDILARI